MRTRYLLIAHLLPVYLFTIYFLIPTLGLDLCLGSSFMWIMCYLVILPKTSHDVNNQIGKIQKLQHCVTVLLLGLNS